MYKFNKLQIFLAVVVVAAVGFYVWRTTSLDGQSQRAWPELDGGVYVDAVKDGGLDYLVPPDQVYDNGQGIDGHPRLIDPKYVDINTADEKIADDLRGIAVEVNGQHRFFPYQIMNWHEVVHTTIADKPLLVTYSALTGSAMVYEPDIFGEPRMFGDSGKIYNNATLLYDESSSTLWNQSTGQAIVGEAIGQQLTIYPSTIMRFDEWKDENPTGLVLSTDTGYARDYGRHPYGAYEKTTQVFYPLNHLDERLSPKEDVYRVEAGDQSFIFSTSILGAQTAPNETVGEGESAVEVVALMDYETFTTRVYNRVVDDRVLTFVREGKTKITDEETDTTWSLTGLGLRGELAGMQLELVPSSHHYAFAQFAMFPNTRISGYEILHPTAESVEGESIEIDATE